MNRLDDDDDVRKPYRIQRKRLGKIRFMREDGEYGFIEAEDFRDDVFFHQRSWQQPDDDAEPGKRPAKLIEPVVDMWVEFEIDDEHFASEQRLRANVVRPTSRPEGRRLAAQDAPYKITRHHPNARKKRPTWRE